MAVTATWMSIHTLCKQGLSFATRTNDSTAPTLSRKFWHDRILDGTLRSRPEAHVCQYALVRLVNESHLAAVRPLHVTFRRRLRLGAWWIAETDEACPAEASA